MRVVLACALLCPLWAQESPPVIRAVFTPPGPVMAGEPVRLTISVLVPTFFNSEPAFPALEIPGAIVAPTEDQSHVSDTINGEPYFGIAKDYMVYPQTAGEFSLPPEPVAVRYSVGGIQSKEVSLKLPAVNFQAIIPPEAEGLGYFIATTKLSVTQRFDRGLTDLKAGDTFHRTIEVRAPQTFSMLLPPVPFEAPDGIRIYRDQPKVDDLRTDRGGFTGGVRVDSTAYLLQKEGSYKLPEILISWWDLTSKQMRTTRIAAIDLTVLPKLSGQTEFAPFERPEAEPPPNARALWASWKRWLMPLALGLGTVVLLASIARRYGPRLKTKIDRRRRERENSTAAHLRRIQLAARKNDAAEAMRQILSFRSRAPGGVEPSELRASLQDLEHALYSKNAPLAWSGAQLADALNQPVRDARSDPSETSRSTSLPPLNP